MLAPFAPSHRHAIAGLRKSRPACLSLHPRANHAAPCSNVTVPIHAATTFNGFLARRCRRGNLVAARLAGEMFCAFHAGLRIVRAGSFHSVAAPRCYCAKLSAHTLRCKI